MQSKIARKILSGILSVSLMLQMGMPVVYAAESNPKQETKTITAFADLAEDVKNITVPMGTAEDELPLPKTVTATVESTPYEEITTGSAITDGTQTKTENAELAVTWQSDKPFSSETAGTFTYTAKLTDESYILAEGVEMPKITATIFNKNRASLLSQGTDIGGLTVNTISGTYGTTPVSGKTRIDIENDATLEITGNPDESAQSFICVTGGNVNLVLDNVNISNGLTGLSVTGKSTVSVTLKNVNTMINNKDNSAGIYVEEGSTLIINEDSTGSLIVQGGTGAAGIGGGAGHSGGTVEINGGTVTATGGLWGAGIGGGSNGGGTVRINGGTVTAKGGDQGAGIGSGAECSEGEGTVRINGGTVTAKGGDQGAGIGGGYKGSGGTVTINEGTVTATGGQWGAGIGGGERGSGSTVTINGGTVIAAGGETDTVGKSVAGIGGGLGGSGGTLLSDDKGNAWINTNSVSANTENFKSGVLFKGNDGTVYGHYSLSKDHEIETGKTMNIPENQSLNISGDNTLTVNGKINNSGIITLNNGVLNGTGTLSGTGEFKTIFTADDIQSIPDQTYTGNVIEPPITINDKKTILGKDFIIDASSYTKTYEDNTNAGTAKVVFTDETDGNNKVEKTFNIVKSGTIFDGGIKTYKGEEVTNTFAYGDTITVKVTPKATGTVPAINGLKKMLSFSAPAANQMALFVGDTQLTDSQTVISGQELTFTYNTTGTNVITPDTPVDITAKYVGSNNMADYEQSAKVTINAIAEVTKGSTVSYAGTLQGAFDFIGSGETGTIKVLKDIVESSNKSVEQKNGTVTLDLNGHILKNTKLFVLNDGCALTINGKSGSKIDAGTEMAISINSPKASVNIDGDVLVTSSKSSYTQGTILNNGGTLNIKNGVIENTCSDSKVFGRAVNNNDGIVIISGGTVVANDGIAIIMAITKDSGYITITGGTIISKNQIAISKDSENSNKVTITNGIILGDDSFFSKSESVAWKAYGTGGTISVNSEIPSGKTFTIPEGATVNIGSGATLTNNGTLLLKGTLNGTGTLAGTGEFKTTVFTADDIQSIPDQTYTGSTIEPTVTFNSKTIMDKEFAIDASDYTKTYENNTNAGTAKVVFTNKTNETDKVEKAFTIVKSGTTFDSGIKTYKGEEAANTFTYGDTITVKVTPKATGTAPVTKGLQAMLSFSAPTLNQMALFVGEKQITEPVNAAGGVYTMTYDTKAKDLAAGSNTITAKYVGNSNMADYSENVTITLNKKAITSAVVKTSASKEYDGKNSFTGVVMTLNGSNILSGDTVKATAEGTVADANVGTGKAFAATSVTLDGDHKNYYSLDKAAVSGNVSITQATAAGVNQELQVVKGLAKDYTFDLTKLLPALSEGKSFGDITYTVGAVTNTDSVLAQNPDIVNGKITLKVENVADKNKAAAIQIKVASKNYKDFTADLTVKTTDKIPLNIEAVFTGGTYNGKPYAYTGTPTFKNGEETLSGITCTAKYAGREGTVYDESETAPVNAGKYNLILTVSGESANTCVGTTTIGFEITKKQITAKPNAASIKSNASFPAYTWSIDTGIAGETITATNAKSVVMEAQENGTKLAAVKEGTFDIVFTTAPAFNQNGDIEKNYDIQIGKGTVTVTAANGGGSSSGSDSGSSGNSGSGTSTAATSPVSEYVQTKYIVEKSKEVTVDLTGGSSKTSLAQMNALIEENKEKPVVLSGKEYTITFEPNTMKVVAGKTAYDFGASFNSGSNYSKIKELSSSSFAREVSYNYSGELPAEAVIKIKVGTQYTGKTLYYYYYNPEKGTLEYMQSSEVDKDGYAAVKQKHCSDYVFLSEKLSGIEKTVERLSGSTRVDTSIKIAKAAFEGKLSAVILGTAENYPDSLSASVLGSKLNAPILLIGNSDSEQEKVLSYMKDNMKADGKVYILGGSGAVSRETEAKISASGFKNIERIEGTDRYETAVKIAETVQVTKGTPVILVYGESYADALSVSSIAAVNQYPILMVKGNEIPEAVKKEIAKINPSKVYIIGLKGAISTEVEKELEKLTSLDKSNIVRIGGENRFATSLNIANYFALKGNAACIATGNNFPDALAGSIYAAKKNAPIVLIDKVLSDSEINFLKGKKLEGITIFGGESAVSKDIEQQLSKLLGQ